MRLLALSGLVVAMVVLPAPAAANRAYGAFKPFENLLTFELSDSGKQVRAATLRVELDCGDGYVLPYAATYTVTRREPRRAMRNRDLLILDRAPGGRLSGRIVSRWGTASAYDEYSGRLEIFNVKARSARVRLTLEWVNGRERRCRLRFPMRAQRDPGVLYVGATDDGEPVWAQLQAGSVAWYSGFGTPCNPEGYLEGIHLNVLSRSGDSNVFGWPELVRGFEYDAGGSPPFKLGVQIAGTLDGSRASGTLRIVGTGGPDDADECDTGVRIWHAVST